MRIHVYCWLRNKALVGAETCIYDLDADHWYARIHICVWFIYRPIVGNNKHLLVITIQTHGRCGYTSIADSYTDPRVGADTRLLVVHIQTHDSGKHSFIADSDAVGENPQVLPIWTQTRGSFEYSRVVGAGTPLFLIQIQAHGRHGYTSVPDSNTRPW